MKRRWGAGGRLLVVAVLLPCLVLAGLLLVGIFLPDELLDLVQALDFGLG